MANRVFKKLLPAVATIRLRDETTRIRSISVVSDWRALHTRLSLLMTMELKLLSLSPIELNITRPSGIPIMA